MKPTLKVFKEAINKCNGNLSALSRQLGIPRSTIYQWVCKDEEFKQVMHDARMRIFDNVLAVSEVMAVGIPEKDENGRIIGWIERPDSNMAKYLLGMLGKNDGFGAEEVNVNVDIKNGVSIHKWLQLNQDKDDADNS